MRMTWLLLTMLAGGLLLTCGCENPLEIDRQTEIDIGREAAAELEKEQGLVSDPAALARVTRIGRRIAAVTEEPDLPWSFKILNQQQANAVALPGGFVYVTKGMLDYVKSEDELAGVIAHEANHVAHHHAKAGIERAMARGLLVELATRRSSETLRQAAGIALDLQLREGYRDKEYEADRFGVTYAHRAGYRARGLRDLLQQLHEKQGDPHRVTWLLQSHPPLSKRVERLDEYLPTLTGR